MNTQTIEAMKELIAKQTKCIDILIDRINNVFKDREGWYATQEYKTSEDPHIKPLPENCNDADMLASYLERLNHKLYWLSVNCCQRELNVYGLTNFDTPEGRKTWYHMEWTKCGIPEFVYEMLGKYPSYTEEFNGSRNTHSPRGDWDWEKLWADNEIHMKKMREDSEKHRKWYDSLSPKEKADHDKKMSDLFEQHKVMQKQKYDRKWKKEMSK